MNEADATELRPAATVVLLRDGDGQLQVLMLRRKSKLAFYGGAWVFPGGRIDPEDCPPGVQLESLEAALRAAVRETREEAGLTLPEAELSHFAQWITPPGRSRRFDTWFFVARAASCQGDAPIVIDAAELDDHRWMSPAAALDAHGEGELELPPPTFVTLWQLRPFASAEAAYRHFADGPVQRYVPRPTPVPGGAVFLYEEDAGYADRDPYAEGPRHRVVAVGGTWRYERD